MFFMGNRLILLVNSTEFLTVLTRLWANNHYCRSYSPLLTRLSTVNPAFLASVTDSGLSFIGELKDEIIFRTGFLHAGQFVNGLADSGRRSVNFPPHTAQPPSHNSYS